MGKKQNVMQEQKVEKSKNISRAIREKDKGFLYYIVYIGLIILLLYPPYFRGMFFDKEFLPTHIYSGILFLLYLIYKIKVLKEYRVFNSPMDYAAIALVGAYFLSIFVAVNIRSAIGEFLKYINYFIAYYLVSDFARTEKDIKTILWTMVISAFGVAFIGIGAAAGTFTYNGAIVGNRISSTLQYPNTLAAYLTAAFMLSTSLWVTEESRAQKAILAFINYTLFLCFLFTLSRGAWLLFPAFYLILIVGMPNQYRLKALGYSFQSFIAAVLASPGFGMAISSSEKTKVWLWYIVGAISSIALFYITEKISERFAFRINPKVVLSIFTIVVLLGGIGVYVALTTEAPLTIAHGKDEEATWKTSWYPIQDVKPDTEYTLKVTVSARPGEEEGQWGAGILINSYDQVGNSVKIIEEYIDEKISEETREITFTTRPDTVRINIGFTNLFPNTEATFYAAELYETNDMFSAQRITLAYKYIPEAISRRLSSISVEDSSLSSRFTFYSDALKIIKDYPILGVGGGGWKAIYKAYQSYEYFTTEVHNFFLQLWVETGTIGFLALIALCITTFVAGIKMIFSDANIIIKVLTWGALSGIVALLGHSGMDFNLSLGAVTLYLWQMFGVIKFLETAFKVEQRETRAILPGLALGGVACGFIIFSFMIYQGYTYGQQAVRSIEEQDIIKAREYFEKAAKYDPYTASYKADLAQLDYFIAIQTENDDLIQKSEDMRVKAVNLEPYNAKLKTQLAAYYLEQGKLDKGISMLEEITKINPFNIENWENLADAYYKTAEVYIRHEQKDKALELLDKLQAIFDEISRYNNIVPKNAKYKLEITNELMLCAYKSKLLAENIDQKGFYKKLDNLIFASDFTIDADNDGVPDLWYIYNSQKGLMKTNIQSQAVEIANSGEGLAYLITRKDIFLEPDTVYRLNLFIGCVDTANTPTLKIFSRKGQALQHQMEPINLTSEITNVSSTFKTTQDIVEGAQWIRIDMPENIKDAILIKSMEIWLE
ncbi:MAG: O-antigen polymerase [Clostridiales bacterium]|nr:O-antigen polymerase [Clostridiales bacterium]